MRKRKKSEDQLAPWIISYGDMVTLLMTFFVLLYSFSLVDLKKFRAMSNSMQQQFGSGGQVESGGGAGVLNEASGQSVIDLAGTVGRNDQVDTLAKEVEAYIERSGLSDVATAVRQERGVVIRFEDEVFFDSGSAEMRTAALPIAQKVAVLLRDLSNHVRVEGHADNVPIHNSIYASNWELSTARATRFIKYLVDAGGIDPQRVSAAGYGEYRPIAENATEDGRQKNRRVDIVLLRSDLSEAEPVASAAQPKGQVPQQVQSPGQTAMQTETISTE